MTDKEKDTVLFLQIARDLKVTETTIRIEIVKTLYDLINRQQAEIERLTAERDNEHRCYLHICEDLKQAVNRNITAKSEAIKDFAERLKEKFGISDVIVTIDSKDIDELAKENIGSEVEENGK